MGSWVLETFHCWFLTWRHWWRTMFCLAQEEDSEAAVPDPNEVSPTLVDSVSMEATRYIWFLKLLVISLLILKEETSFVLLLYALFMQGASRQCSTGIYWRRTNCSDRFSVHIYIYIYIGFLKDFWLLKLVKVLGTFYWYFNLFCLLRRIHMLWQPKQLKKIQRRFLGIYTWVLEKPWFLETWNFLELFLGILLCFVRPFRIHMLDSMCFCKRKMNTRLRLFLGLLVYIYIVLETALVVVLKHLAIETWKILKDCIVRPRKNLKNDHCISRWQNIRRFCMFFRFRQVHVASRSQILLV